MLIVLKTEDAITPINPVGLKLALDLKNNTAYIARPCQFVTGVEKQNCSPVFWTNARYIPEVIEAINSVIGQIKQGTHAPTLRIIRFSGGWTLAALIAIERRDIKQLIILAAPLDINAWAFYHGFSKLRYSQNPAEKVEALSKITQIHFVGDNDEVVPPELTVDFLILLPKGHKAIIVRISGADHRCCWKAMQIRAEF